MLILADGEDVRDLLPADKRIRLIHLAESRSIGEKRNFGCQHASGSVIAHWDDDDFSAPGRLAHQMRWLLESRKAVTGFHNMRFTDGARWWQYCGDLGYALGTSLMYRREWWQEHPFKAKQVGEDNDFVYFAHQRAQLATCDAGELMHATIHPGNTSPRMIGSNWKAL